VFYSSTLDVGLFLQTMNATGGNGVQGLVGYMLKFVLNVRNDLSLSFLLQKPRVSVIMVDWLRVVSCFYRRFASNQINAAFYFLFYFLSVGFQVVLSL